MAVEHFSLDINVPFWSHQLSFLFVGILVFASIRGVLTVFARVIITACLHVMLFDGSATPPLRMRCMLLKNTKAFIADDRCLPCWHLRFRQTSSCSF
jgi:hypothetical protein